MGSCTAPLSQLERTSDKHSVEKESLTAKNSLVGTHELRSNTLMDNIDDEVLPDISSEADLSESLDTKSPQRVDDKGNLFQGKVFKEPVLTTTQSQKRPLPGEGHEDPMDQEKRRKPSMENIREMELQLMLPSATPTSYVREHLSQKLQDGSITVAEFLKLFSIDFVIHKPRQSILPGRIAPDLDRKTEDLLIEKHINHLKQRVYETDCQILKEMVEGLKARLRDQDNLLKSVHGTLWEAVNSFSDEEYFILFVAAFWCQVEREEDILQKEKQTLEGTGVENCEMTLKSRQQGVENVNKAIAESERQMCELEMQKKNSVDEVDRLRKETLELENHIAMLDRSVSDFLLYQGPPPPPPRMYNYHSILL
ncbi:unnamed protein product [Coregonus sp. 'balchen']|nr:unnamed protein product [Coregonus sp. 'balchen']